MDGEAFSFLFAPVYPIPAPLLANSCERHQSSSTAVSSHPSNILRRTNCIICGEGREHTGREGAYVSGEALFHFYSTLSNFSAPLLAHIIIAVGTASSCHASSTSIQLTSFAGPTVQFGGKGGINGREGRTDGGRVGEGGEDNSGWHAS